MSILDEWPLIARILIGSPLFFWGLYLLPSVPPSTSQMNILKIDSEVLAAFIVGGLGAAIMVG